MYRIMLGAGVCLEITVVISLHTQYCLDSQYRIKVRVFSAGLLSTSPPWVTEYVHIGTPEGKFRVSRVIDYSHRNIEYIMV